MDNNTKHKIAVYTGDLSYSVAKGVLALVNNADVEAKIFVHERSLPLKRKIALQLKNLQKNKFWRVHEVATIVLGKIKDLLFSKKYLQVGHEHIPDFVVEVTQHANVSVEYVGDINSIEAVNIVKQFSPTLGISLAAPILKKDILQVAKTNLNLHKGKLPQYRGMPPAFWEIYHQESSVGCSIHAINEALDEGEIVLESQVKIDKWSTPKGLQIQLDELGVNLMVEAVKSALAGTMKTTPQVGEGRTFTKPTISEYRKLLANVSPQSRQSSITNAIKDSIFCLYSCLIAPVRSYVKGLKGKQDVIVLLYHKVNDYQRDSLTVGVEQFDKQMAYIRKNFPVASIKSLIKGEISRHEKRPIIVVSFDDGYLDNYENAYPICVRNKIPCSFFVSTDMINTGEGFEHDIKYPGDVSIMTWQHLIEMKASGMFIGSHTCSHIDCSKESPEELHRQFEISQQTLDEKLGTDEAILAYPFGGKHQFTETAKEIALALEYKAILSAYGGINHDINIHNIKRGGIDWNYSHQAFKARLLGWQQ